MSAGSHRQRRPTTVRARREDEGLSYIDFNGKRILLKEAIEVAGDDFLGADVMREYGGWNLLCKFFDNLGPIPHHMHQSDEFAKKVGRKGKPEAYYFPPQYNFKGQQFPVHVHGPGARHHQGRFASAWSAGTRATTASSYLSKAYRLKPGTGWQIDAGILHAPGSLVTYEPQVNSDVFGMFQSMVEGRAVPWDLLVKDVPPSTITISTSSSPCWTGIRMSIPEFGKNNMRFPVPVRDAARWPKPAIRKTGSSTPGSTTRPRN